MTARNNEPAVRIADEVAQLAQRCAVADLPDGPPDAFDHAQLCVRWVWHVANGHVGSGQGYPIAFVEASIAHNLDPVRYWPLLCALGQLYRKPVPISRLDAQRKIHGTIRGAANAGS